MNVSVTGGMLFENQSLGKEFGFLVTVFSYRTEFLQGMALGEFNLPLRLSEARGAKKLWQARRLACAEAALKYGDRSSAMSTRRWRFSKTEHATQVKIES